MPNCRQASADRLMACRALAIFVLCCANHTSPASAQNAPDFKCPPRITGLDCSIGIFEKLGARDAARSGKESWQKVAFLIGKSLPGPWVSLPDGSTYNPALKERRYVVSKRPDRAVDAALAEWDRFYEIVFLHHLNGTLTFRHFACEWDCAGHTAGYDWAKGRRVSAYEDCKGDNQSFVEGCEAYVADARGDILPNR